MAMISGVSMRLTLTSGSSQLFVLRMPMGWSLNLWLCQNALVDAMVASEVARTGQPRPDVEERVLVDHRLAPLLAPGKPILAPYVDIAIIIAWSPEESRDTNRHLAS